jgi:SAM-dependent methyltransferase
MYSAAETVRDHYQSGSLDGDPVAGAMQAFDRGRSDVRAMNLEPLDQFHAGGAAATLKLGELLELREGTHILDAGSGLGGPARILAERFGVRVTGIDLTPSYVELAKRLADVTHLSDRVSYNVGNLLDLPFDDATFDGAYSQHVVMNVMDRYRAYAEIRRVLKTGAHFAFHDVIASDTGERPIYPTPWAESPLTSFLLDEDETTSVLHRARLRVEEWEDVTAGAIEAIARVIVAGPTGPTLGSVMGPRFPAMAQNYRRNLAEGRLRVVMGRAKAF